MSRKTRRPSDTRRSTLSAAPLRFDPFSAIPVCALALYLVRFFLPAESAHLGETLWVVNLWLLLATVVCFVTWRFGETFVCDRRDAAVWLLVLGHVLGALIILCTDGHKRAATNLLWEWIGVGVAFSMLKERVGRRSDFQRLLTGLVITLIVLSGLGLWQHFVWYPQQRELLLEFERLTPGSTRYADLAEQLGPLANAADPAAAYVIRQRLMASTEPIGRFALANTLGGLLAVSLIFLVTQLLNVARRSCITRNALLLSAATILVTVCLLLTKSRTAWSGLLVGLAVWSVLTFGRRMLERRTMFIVVGLLAVVVVLAILVALTGGLDALVVTESPKSIQYRFEYWMGTWGVIKEAPVFGIGPGNFRQHYLRYKLPQSSEEILDPHNLFLDAWANGGLLALLGLLLVVPLGLYGQTQILNGQETDDADSTIDRTLVSAGLAACILLLAWDVLRGLGIDWQLTLLAVSAISVGSLFRWAGTQLHCSAEMTIGAAAAMLVHLLGQGGIGMPVVGLTLLLVLLRAPNVNAGELNGSPMRQPLAGVLATATALAAMTACLFSATRPVLFAGAAMDVGEYEAARGSFRSARDRFEDAAEADPLDPEPWWALAELDMLQWQRATTSAEADYQRALRHAQQALARDPDHPKRYWTLGQWEAQRFRRTDDPAAVEQAIQWFERAIDGYPYNARIRADYALALAAAGQSEAANTQSGRALELDELNRQLGHYDKLLDDETRRRLQTL